MYKYIYVYIYICMFIYTVWLLICLFMHLSICTYLFINLSIHPSIHLLMNLSIHLSTYIYQQPRPCWSLSRRPRALRLLRGSACDASWYCSQTNTWFQLRILDHLMIVWKGHFYVHVYLVHAFDSNFLRVSSLNAFGSVTSLWPGMSARWSIGLS